MVERFFLLTMYINFPYPGMLGLKTLFKAKKSTSKAELDAGFLSY